jgi:DNA-binding transcriptional LysR family regulator
MDLVSTLRTFLRVAETGSFSAAAGDLRLTQPAVSRQVSALEERYKVRLLHRTTSGLSLTAEGERMIANARRVLEAVEEMGDAVGHLGGTPSGMVRLSLPAPLGLAVSAALGGLLAAHPGLAVELRLSEEASDMVEEGLDLEVRLGPVADSSLICRRIGWTTAYLVAAPAYLQRHPAPRRPADLSAHDCICYSRAGHGRDWSFSDGANDVSLPITPRLVANSAVAVHRAALAGLGLAVLSHILVEADLAEGRLVQLMPEFPPARLPIHVVYPSRRNLPLRVRTVLDFLTEFVRQDPAMRLSSQEAV